MSAQTYTLPEFKVPVIKQSAFDAGALAGTLEEGQPYNIGDVKSPDIYKGTTAPTTSTVGEVGDVYIALIGSVIRIWDCIAVNGANYTWRERVRDVTINGTSTITNGVGNIPIAGAGLGVSKPGSGLVINSSTGAVSVNKASNSAIEGKTEAYNPIVPANLDKAIEEGLGAYNGTAFTDAKKNTACSTIGAQRQITISGDFDNMTTFEII